MPNSNLLLPKRVKIVLIICMYTIVYQNKKKKKYAFAYTHYRKNLTFQVRKQNRIFKIKGSYFSLKLTDVCKRNEDYSVKIQ